MSADDGLVHYPSGATRSADADDFRYDLLPLCALARWAQRMGHGAKTHGDHNWKKGFPAGVIENHLMRHLVMWMEGDRSDDHLAAIMCNVAFLIHFEETTKPTRAPQIPSPRCPMVYSPDPEGPLQYCVKYDGHTDEHAWGKP